MSYKHGVYTSEEATSIIPPREVDSALPVVIGTAPVHMVNDGEIGPVNEPKLCFTYKEAVDLFGNSSDWDNYTLCEFIKCIFALYNVGPVVLVNVFDPSTHKTNVASESQTFDVTTDELTVDHPGIVGDPVVKDDTDTTTYVEDTDYTVNRITGVFTRLATGGIGSGDTVHITYDYGDPTQVAASDIVGGVDANGVYTGLELVEKVFPTFRKVPGQIVAPGWSQDTTVVAVMMSKADNINGHFKAIAVVDIPESVTDYTDAPGYKNDNNLTDELVVVCYPKVKQGSDEYWMSSHVAALIAQVDADNNDVPYKSPSNQRFQIDGAVNGGTAVWLGPDQAEYLNGQGIVTAFNFVGGWKCYGNRTGAYPGVTDVKDVFIPIRRMFNWIGNVLILTYYQPGKLDGPITRRNIETIVDSVQFWLNGLTSREQIVGGRIEFREDENVVTDLMDGIIKFHVYITPPSPAKEIEFILEYDPGYLSGLFS